MQRRSFIQGASAGGLALLAGTATNAAARDDKPAAKADGVLSLTGKVPARYPGGTLRESTVADAPAIPNMSSTLIDLDVGGMRGLHWHKTAAEIGYVVKGSAVLIVVDSDTNSEVGPVHEGDIYLHTRRVRPQPDVPGRQALPDHRGLRRRRHD